MTTLRLEAEGLDPFDLEDDQGLTVSAFDLGFPQVRGVVALRADSDGENDTTALYGARVVTVAGAVREAAGVTRQEVLDRLASFLRPDLRPYLYFDSEEDANERRVRLRVDTHTRPIVSPGLSYQVLVSWRAPDGVQEAATATSETAEAAVDDEGGLTFPISFDLEFADTPPDRKSVV